MKHSSVISFIFMYSICNAATITNECDAGRLGDNILNYIKAKYLSLKYEIPFQFNPSFVHADKFVFYEVEPRLQSQRGRQVKITDENQLSQPNENTCYRVSFYCRLNGWHNNFDIVEWDQIKNDAQFMEYLRRVIKNRFELKKIKVPEGAVSVAVHVRRLSGGDHLPIRSRQFFNASRLKYRKTIDEFMNVRGKNFFDVCFPFKFLPDQFYVDQIQRIADMLPDRLIFIYIFTDDKRPQAICDLYKQHIKRKNVIFGCREVSEYEPCAVDELMSMASFDCLIRSKSNFSQVAEFIGNHKIVISSEQAAWYSDEHGNDCLVVEDVKTRIDEAFLRNCALRILSE